MTSTWSLDTLFGPAPLAGDELAVALSALTREAFGHEADPARTVVEPVAHAFGSPATGALLRVRGCTPDDRPWTLFCKVLQHPRHWALIDQLPDFIRAEFLADFPWRQELSMWDEEFVAAMPAGIRVPRQVALHDLGDDRLALWTEHVEECTSPWNLERYAAAARALGRWNQRCTTPALAASSGEPPLFSLRKYSESTLHVRGLGPISDDALWGHPWLAEHGALRAELLRLGGEVDRFLDLAGGLTLCRPHGDASPQNLLVPREAPGTFVAIDIGFQSPLPLGSDLSQLTVGLVHADLVPAAMLPAIADTVLAAYVEGLAAEGWDGDPTAIEQGFLVSLVVRSGFDGFRYELLAADPDDPAARASFDQRVELASFIADRAGSLLPGSPRSRRPAPR